MIACRTCGQALPQEQFKRNTSQKSGYTPDCKPCLNERARANYGAKPEKQRASALARYHRLGEVGRQRSREWYRNNKESVKGRHVAAKLRRRARILAADCGCVNTASLDALVGALGGACVYCDGPFEHWDHGIPLSRGGLHCLNNLVPSCARCNHRKNSKTQDEFLTLIAA